MGTKSWGRLLPPLLLALTVVACSDGDGQAAEAPGPVESAAPAESTPESGEAEDAEHAAAGGHGVDYSHQDDWAGECGVGQKQSPIDLSVASPAGDDVLPDIAFDYEPAPLALKDTGHAIQFDLPKTSRITLRDEDRDGELDVYALAQVHVHAPSEHVIGERAFDLEVHLVHEEVGVPSPRLAVIGVLVETDDDAGDHPGYAAVVENISDDLTKEPVEVPGVSVDPEALIPRDRSYFRYDGSLTTPDCTEGVSWQVLTTPITMSSAQVAAFTAAYSDTARSPQDLNGRAVQDSRG